MSEHLDASDISEKNSKLKKKKIVREEGPAIFSFLPQLPTFSASLSWGVLKWFSVSNYLRGVWLVVTLCWVSAGPKARSGPKTRSGPKALLWDKANKTSSLAKALGFKTEEETSVYTAAAPLSWLPLLSRSLSAALWISRLPNSQPEPGDSTNRSATSYSSFSATLFKLTSISLTKMEIKWEMDNWVFSKVCVLGGFLLSASERSWTFCCPAFATEKS